MAKPYNERVADEIEAIQARNAELEAALREIDKEMHGAHDGACILPVKAILRRVLNKG